MNKHFWRVRRAMLTSLCSMAIFPCLALPSYGADAQAAPSWHAQTLGQAIGYMLLFALIGIVLAVAGFRLFDRCTPGDLNKEIFENRNVAAAIVAGAVILGLCLIIAAAMLG